MDQRRESGRDDDSRDGRARRRPDHDPSRPQKRRPAPVDTDGRRRRVSEEIHTAPRKRRPTESAKPRPEVGTLRDAVAVWAARPIVGIPAKHVGRAAVAILTVVVLLITGFGWSRVNSLNAAVTKLGGLELGGNDDGAVDILLVGTDSRNDAKGNPPVRGGTPPTPGQWRGVHQHRHHPVDPHPERRVGGHRDLDPARLLRRRAGAGQEQDQRRLRCDARGGPDQGGRGR
ncbi:hypothetical protein ACFOJ6_19145 [Gordonia humi]|uniref:hypothetical protein n=1 Tax=Gordonia humi TaxID=686429 RepID=UPI003615F433